MDHIAMCAVNHVLTMLASYIAKCLTKVCIAMYVDLFHWTPILDCSIKVMHLNGLY